MTKIKNYLNDKINQWLMGDNCQVTYRGPYTIHSYKKITRIYRDSKLVTSTPNVEVAKDLIDSYRKLGRVA